MLINEDKMSIGQLRTLIGTKGTVTFAGLTSKCIVESIILECDGIKLLLRDAYNRKMKRFLSKFTPDEE